MKTKYNKKGIVITVVLVEVQGIRQLKSTVILCKVYTVISYVVLLFDGITISFLTVRFINIVVSDFTENFSCNC